MNSSIFGKDTPIGCPGAGERAGVYVPTAGNEKNVHDSLKNGAGIAGFGNNDGTLSIYFESNRFDDTKLQVWANRVRTSYDRMVAHAPTTSRATVTPDKVEQIGFINGSGIQITKPEALQRWLVYCNAEASGPEGTSISWGR